MGRNGLLQSFFEVGHLTVKKLRCFQITNVEFEPVHLVVH